MAGPAHHSSAVVAPTPAAAAEAAPPQSGWQIGITVAVFGSNMFLKLNKDHALSFQANANTYTGNQRGCGSCAVLEGLSG